MFDIIYSNIIFKCNVVLNPFFFVLFSIYIGLLIGGVWAYRKFL